MASVVLTVTAADPVRGQERWDIAEQAIERIGIAQFADVPTEVSREITDMGCAVPQAWGTQLPHNVISGEFAAAGQIDWAVLCSREGSSEIVIIWGGDSRCPALANRSSDRSYLQDTGVDGILFSRQISAVSSEALTERWVGPATDDVVAVHDAIADAFIEKGATGFYCAGGRWREFIAD